MTEKEMKKIVESILTPNQRKAIGFFEKHGYLVLEGARGCGKTEILSEIIRRNPKKKIGVRCLSRYHYDYCYLRFENCRYLFPSQKTPSKIDILIGDEVLIKPSSTVETACALTQKYVVLRIKNDLPHAPSRKQLNALKKAMNEHEFMIHYGQYL
jgi:hypothetical protein